MRYVKTKIFLIATFILSIGILASCDNKQANNTNKQDRSKDTLLCKNKLLLISGTDNIPCIELNFENSWDSCINQIENAFDFDLCDKVVYYTVPFNFTTSNIEISEHSTNIKFRYYKHCNDHKLDNIHMLTVLINRDSQIMINGELLQNTDQASIDNIVCNYYLFEDNKQIRRQENSYIALMWDAKSNKKELSNLILKITNAYLYTVETYTNSTFQKSICELSNTEIKTVMNSLPFELQPSNHLFEEPPILIE